MFKCTYIVLLNNNEDNIPHLINSLKKLEGSFLKEFIIIDDGSKDNSLNIVKNAVTDLPKTTIITQENQGPAVSINKAVMLANGDYIHFVEGDEILHPLSTDIMIDACGKLGAEVACYKLELSEKSFNSKEKDISPDQKLITTPLQEVLINKIPAIRNIGGSGSLVTRKLLEKIDRADSSIYSQTMSLSLRCAKYSNFAFINNVLSRKRKSSQTREPKFESYNNLRSIYNFASNHKEIFQNLNSELLYNLSLKTSTKKAKIEFYLRSAWAKYFKKSTSLDQVLELYKKEYEGLF